MNRAAEKSRYDTSHNSEYGRENEACGLLGEGETHLAMKPTIIAQMICIFRPCRHRLPWSEFVAPHSVPGVHWTTNGMAVRLVPNTAMAFAKRTDRASANAYRHCVWK
jgi:hypothetical protein